MVSTGQIISTPEIRPSKYFPGLSINTGGAGTALGLLHLLCAPFPHRPVTEPRHSVRSLLAGLFLCDLMLWSPQTLSSISGTQRICHTFHELPLSVPRLENSLEVTRWRTCTSALFDFCLRHCLW